MEFRFSHNQVNLRKILKEFYSLGSGPGFFIYELELEDEETNIYVQAIAEKINEMLIPSEEYQGLRTGAEEDLIRNGWSKEKDVYYLKRFSDVEIRSGRAASDIMKAFSCYRDYDIDCEARAQFEEYSEKRIKLTERDLVSMNQASAPTYVLQDEEEKTETIENKLTKIEELYQKSLISEQERIAMRKKALGLD